MMNFVVPSFSYIYQEMVTRESYQLKGEAMREDPFRGYPSTDMAYFVPAGWRDPTPVLLPW